VQSVVKKESAGELFARLWREKYAARAAEAQAAEGTRRAEDFVDGPRPVGPWLLRPLTAYDLLLCEGHECPLVGGEAIALRATPDELWWFVWFHQAEAPSGPFARWRFLRRMRRRHFAEDGSTTPAYDRDLAAAVEFVERHFADSGAPKKVDSTTGEPTAQRELGTSWIAGLMVALCCEMGPVDPVSQRPWAHVPLGCLWQYLRILDLRRGNGPAIAATAANRLRAECLDEVNQIRAAQRAAAA
jgi:hypothetical protein